MNETKQVKLIVAIECDGQTKSKSVPIRVSVGFDASMMMHSLRDVMNETLSQFACKVVKASLDHHDEQQEWQQCFNPAAYTVRSDKEYDSTQRDEIPTTTAEGAVGRLAIQKRDDAGRD